MNLLTLNNYNLHLFVKHLSILLSIYCKKMLNWVYYYCREMVEVIYPSIDRLLNIVDSKYKLVHIAADRAKVMKEYKVKKEIRYCPICDEEHEIVLKKIRQVDKVKDCEIENDVFVYVCEKSNEEFEDGDLLDKNLMLMRDAYRRKNNLLTKDEIVAIREKYKITQEDLSNILGLGEKTIARYETNTIQDRPYDVLLRKFISLCL